MGGATPPGTIPLTLQARATTLTLKPGRQPASAIWELAAVSSSSGIRLKRGDRCEVSLRNDLPAGIAPVWRGLDGAATAEPLLGHPVIPPRTTENLTISMPHAGTFMADLWLFGETMKLPVRPLPLIVEETEPIAVDRDELFLIEDWRLTTDGTALVPGTGGGDIAPLYTVNGRAQPSFDLGSNERLRLRFISGCQRAVVAVKIEGAEVVVVAIDGQPAEPFVARNGAFVLAPGSRCDVILDATAPPGSASAILLHDGKEAQPIARLLTTTEPALRPSRLPPPQPLPSNELPVRLDLKGALRFEFNLEQADPLGFSLLPAPAFRTKTGRTVVLTLRNPRPVATVFRLHGHHFRLLDRLDDGWKPYWLDTLAIEPGQTQRVAFAATYPGRWLLESVATDWAAPPLVRWYAVE